jgi:hypothetical protein
VGAISAPKSVISGDERPARELPKDGAWVRYQKTVQNLKTGKTFVPATVTLSFVGTQIEDGQPCRWLELKLVIPEREAGTGMYVSKVLVPEKDLWESDKPFEHARRTWVRRPDGAVTKPPNGARDDLTYDELMLWTPGMLKGFAPAKGQSKDVEYQAGLLKDAEARTTERIYELDGGTKYKRKYTTWVHPDLPMGFAEARIIQEQFQGNESLGSFSIDYRIEDIGVDAKTELPDNN